MNDSMHFRETEYKMKEFFRDANGQAHFPTTRLDGSMIDHVSLKHIGYGRKVRKAKKAVTQ